MLVIIFLCYLTIWIGIIIEKILSMYSVREGSIYDYFVSKLNQGFSGSKYFTLSKILFHILLPIVLSLIIVSPILIIIVPVILISAVMFTIYYTCIYLNLLF